MNLKVKLIHPNASLPNKAHDIDAGYDLTCVNIDYDVYGNMVFYTGVCMQIHEGYVGLLFPRSSVSKYDLTLANSVGVIDAGYVGEIILKYKPASLFQTDDKKYPNYYNIGDKVGQLVIVKHESPIIEQVNEFTETERGTKGFGSSGN